MSDTASTDEKRPNPRKVREGLVVRGREVPLLGTLAREAAEQLHVARLTEPEHDEARLEVTQRALGRLDEVEALLLDEPRDDADDRPVGLARESARELERAPRGTLALQVVA